MWNLPDSMYKRVVELIPEMNNPALDIGDTITSWKMLSD